MTKKPKMTKKEKDLIRRYLIWCYKTTKEELDKIDRYFTQLTADAFVLQRLKRAKDYRSMGGDHGYKDRVDRFESYMAGKKANVLKKKFKDVQARKLSDDYRYLKGRFEALEAAIRHFLGVSELKKITDMYEREMTRRILEAREHT